MMRRASRIVSLAALAAFAACTEEVEPEVFLTPSGPEEASGWAHFVVFPATNTRNETYRMKLNGAWWMYSAYDEDSGEYLPHYQMLDPNWPIKAPVPDGPYVLELIRGNGDTALVTAPFSVERGRDLTILVYGDPDALASEIFIDVYDDPNQDAWNWMETGGYADVAEDHVKVRALNACGFYESMDVELCNATGCTVAAQSIPYGGVYEAIVPATYTELQAYGSSTPRGGVSLTWSAGRSAYLVLLQDGPLSLEDHFFGPL